MYLSIHFLPKSLLLCTPSGYYVDDFTSYSTDQFYQLDFGIRGVNYGKSTFVTFVGMGECGEVETPLGMRGGGVTRFMAHLPPEILSGDIGTEL